MNRCTTLLVSCFLPLCGLAQLPVATNSLTDELLDVAVHRLKTYGPDHEVAQFVSTELYYAWPRREIFFTLSRSYLDDTTVSRVAGAIDVLCRFRGFRPSGPVSIHSFEEINSNFFQQLDTAISQNFPHFKSLHNDEVYKFLAEYLGFSQSPKARAQLKEIIGSTPNNESALISLCWRREPADMDFLLTYMLADTSASRSLPYHFRAGYGTNAIPYLANVMTNAKSANTRLDAAFELVHLRISAGFEYLETIALKDPKPERLHFSQLEQIRMFATDYLSLPHGSVNPEVIAAFIAKKQKELSETKSQ